MAYIIGTETGNLGGQNEKKKGNKYYTGGNGTVDFATANKQAQQRATQQKPTNTPTNDPPRRAVETPVSVDYGPSEPAFDWEAYYARLQAEAQARANAAYERNMERIASAYGNAAGSLRSNYDSTVGRLNAARDKSMGDVRSDAEDSLRQAYINNMMTRKNLNQRLSAMGMNGGATETTMSSLENQYGKSRSGINETLNKNISDLDMKYGDNLASALQSYNSAKANLDLQRMQLEMQAENARQNAESSSMNAYMNIDSGYMNALQAALANQAKYQYDPTKATNDFIAGQAQQASSATEGNAYAKYVAQQLLAAGNSTNDVNNYLLSKGYSQQTLQDILRQLAS